MKIPEADNVSGNVLFYRLVEVQHQPWPSLTASALNIGF